MSLTTLANGWKPFAAGDRKEPWRPGSILRPLAIGFTGCVLALALAGGAAAETPDEASDDSPGAAMVEALTSGDPERVAEALAILEEDREQVADAVPGLVALFESAPGITRVRVLALLEVAGPDAAGASRSVTEALLSGVATLSPAPPPQPTLPSATVAATVEALASTADRDEAIALMWALATAGASPAGAEQALLRWGDDEDSKARLAAVSAAAAHPDPGDALVEWLIRRADDPLLAVRAGALRALSWMSLHAPAVRAGFVNQREATVAELRAMVRALARIGQDSSRAIEAIRRAMEPTADDAIRLAAVQSATMLGSAGAPLVDTLRLLLSPSSSWEHAWSRSRLGELARGEAPLELVRRIAAQDRALMMAAIEAAAGIGSEAEPLVPDLLDLAARLEGSDRDRVLRALGGVGKGAVEAVPLLMAEAGDRESRFRETAIISLGGIGAAGGEGVVRLLIQAMDEEHWDGRWLAAWALRQVGEEAEVALFPLMRASESADARLRWAAVTALGALGEAGRRAPPELQALLADAEPSVRRAAMESILSLAADDAQALGTTLVLLDDADEQVRSSAESLLVRYLRRTVEERRFDRLPLVRGLGTELRRSGAAAAPTVLATVEEAVPILKVMEAALDDESLLSDDERADRRRARTQRRILQLPLLLMLLWGGAVGLQWWLRPHRLVAWDAGLRGPTGPFGRVLAMASLVGPAAGSARAQGAWVAEHALTLERARERSGWLRARPRWVPVSLKVNGRRTDAGDTSALRRLSALSGQRVVIHGEGGTGASALAAELLRRTAAPTEGHDAERVLVLCFDLLPPEQASADPVVLLERLLLAHGVSEIRASVAFLESLWASGRVVLFVDGFDGLDAQTRRTLQQATAGEVSAVFTLRTHAAGSINARYQVEPGRLAENELLPFVAALGSDWNDARRLQAAEGCSRLAAAFAPDAVPAGWAAMLAEIVSATTAEREVALPRTRGALALRHVHARLARCGFDNDRIADLDAPLCALAWRSLQAELTPMPVPVAEVESCLDGVEGAQILELLSGEAGLLVPHADGGLVFDLDPVAEHLAACHLVGEHADSAYAWNRFLADAALVPGAPGSVRGFLQAVREWAVAGADRAPSAEVLAELDRRLR